MDFSPLLAGKRRRRWMNKVLEKAGLEDGEVRLTRVYLEPTTRCNLQCRGCIRHSWSEGPGDMSMETFHAFLSGIESRRWLQTVAFWGFGEPLLHPKITEMISRVHSRGLQTEIITNGMLLDAGMSAALVDAGLDSLVVSLDGATPEVQAMARSGAFLPTILANIEYAKSVSARRPGRELAIGIEFVLTKSNIHEFAKVIEFARRIDAEFVVASNLLPYTESMKNEILYWMSGQEYTTPQFIEGRPAILFPSIDRNAENTRVFQDLIPGLWESGIVPWSPGETDGYCPFVERGSVSITWDGRVCPCISLMHDHQYYLLGLPKEVKSYDLGNIRSKPLRAIWEDEEYRRFRKRVVDFDYAPCARCGGCEMSVSNKEDCIGSPFPTCGGCLWSKGILLCP